MEYLGNIDLLHEAMYAISNKKFEYAKELLDLCEIEKADEAIDFLDLKKPEDAEKVIKQIIEELKE